MDTNHEDGRSYISAVSEVLYDPAQTCNGTAKVSVMVHYYGAWAASSSAMLVFFFLVLWCCIAVVSSCRLVVLLRGLRTVHY